MSTVHHQVLIQRSQRGFTLIEIMIALMIGLFLMGALLTIVQANRRTFGDQSQLAQLQDSERMALSMMSDVIQQAGYFPDPTANTVASTLTAAGSFAVGQAISGTYVAAAPGDTISVRYMTAGGDGILNCSGLPNAVGNPNTLYVNRFYINNTGDLNCDVTTAAGTQTFSLVSGVTNNTSNLGVTNLRVLYGVKANAALPGNNVDSYLNASEVTNWSSVIAVQIQLTFTNPLYIAGNGQQQTITVQRVVGVMNQLGPIQ